MEIDIRECKDTYAILITYFILVLQHGIHIKRLTKCHWFSYVFIYKINDILLILIKAESEITNKTSLKFIQKTKIKKHYLLNYHYNTWGKANRFSLTVTKLISSCIQKSKHKLLFVTAP